MKSLKLCFIFVLYITSSKAYRTECPSSCNCYQQAGIHSIFCADVGLTHLPNYFNFEVKILNFTGNSLPNMSNMFLNDRYQSLEILDLSRNNIRHVDDRSFSKLKNILEIDLSDNEISTFSGDLFEDNRFLNIIRFNRNPIEEIVNYAFSPSAYLRRLNFQGCKIKHVRKYAFVNIPLLQYLNLRDNNLKSLSLSVVQFTPQLGSLLLEGNSWRCNKKLWLLLKWLRSRNSTVDSLLCVYGETKDAVLWDTMEINNPMKLWNRKVAGNVKQIKWSKKHVRKRVRRAALNEMTNDRAGRRSGRKHRVQDDVADVADSDYPTLDPGSDDEDGKEDSGGGSHRRRPDLTFELEHETKSRIPHRYQPPWYYLKEDEGSADTDSSPNKNKEYTFVALPRQHTFQDQKSKILVHQNFEDSDEVGAGSEDASKDRVVIDGLSKDGSSEDFGFNLPIQTHIFMGTKVVTLNPASENNSRGVEGGAGSEVVNANADTENMKVMLVLIAIEFVLLAILLYVLYKLWKWNKKSVEPEGNEPLNNDKNKMKNYDTHSSGYKRCSLSVDDYSDLRTNASDDTKYDSESGYLSYHRYNSVECDNEEQNRRQSQQYTDKEGADNNKSNTNRSSLSNANRRYSNALVENKNYLHNQLKAENIRRQPYHDVDQESTDGYVYCHNNGNESPFEEYETLHVNDGCDSVSDNDDRSTDNNYKK